MTYKISVGLMCGILLLMDGCKKFVQVSPPPTALVGASVYNSDANAESAVNGIYATLAQNSVAGGFYGISTLTALSADEYALWSGSGDPVLNTAYKNALVSNGGSLPPEWTDLYTVIYQANAAIYNIGASASVTDSVKTRLVGEAECVRAFCYFYLTNMYGDVPLAVSPDYETNKTLARSPKATVYQQIVADLSDAISRLGVGFTAPDGSPSAERVRPNRLVANALLARTYLYLQQWDSAAIEANAVIDNGQFTLVNDLDSAFLVSNTEAIWQLEMPDNGYNAPDGIFQLAQQNGGPFSNAPLLLSDSLMTSFEPGDLRRMHWMDSVQNGTVVYYFPFKYKLFYTGNPPAEYPTLLRLSEQILIRAEAQAEIGGAGLAGAINDLNAIRMRAGLTPTTATSQADVLSAIMKERRIELFGEYGHRWFDLIRTGAVNTVMLVITPEKGGNWAATDTLYPIPSPELLADPNLRQNPGYN